MTSDFQNQFLSFKDQLSSYVFRLVTNRQLAEDIVQDTFVKVSEKIDTFQGKSSFKTWVFTIATNLAKNQLKGAQRWAENAQDYGAMLHMKSEKHWNSFHEVFYTTPEKQYEVKEHLVYCFNCLNKTLEIEQQVCLLLKDVYDFKVHEIMLITELSEGKVKHAIADARKNMIRIFDNRCSFINKEGVCHQCTELTGVFNPKLDAHLQAKELKLVRKGTSTDKELLYNLRVDLVKNTDPLQSKNSIVTTYMLESSEEWVREGKKQKVLEFSSDSKP